MRVSRNQIWKSMETTWNGGGPSRKVGFERQPIQAYSGEFELPDSNYFLWSLEIWNIVRDWLWEFHLP